MFERSCADGTAIGKTKYGQKEKNTKIKKFKKPHGEDLAKR